MDLVKNHGLSEIVEPENDLKNMLIEYVGEKLNPEDQNVNIEMIAEVMAKEFPEFLLAVAEENWVRGYQQALDDAEQGEKLYKDFLETQASDLEIGECFDNSKSESD